MKKLWLIGILIVSLFFLACSGQFETTLSLAEDEEVSGGVGSYNYYLHVTQIDKKNSFCYLDAYLSSSADPSTEQIVLDKETPVKISGFTASLIGIRESFTGDKCLIKVSNKRETTKITGAAARAPPPKPRTATTPVVTPTRTTSATPAQPATSSRATPTTTSSRASPTTATTTPRTGTSTATPRAGTPTTPAAPTPTSTAAPRAETPVVAPTPTVPATPAAPQAPLAQCRDKIDNDGDGKVDHPSDLGCSSLNDNDETDPVTTQPTAPTPAPTTDPRAGTPVTTTPSQTTSTSRAGAPTTPATPATPAVPATPTATAAPRAGTATILPTQPTAGRAGTVVTPVPSTTSARTGVPVVQVPATTSTRAGAPSTTSQPAVDKATSLPASATAGRTGTSTTLPQPGTATRAGTPTQPITAVPRTTIANATSPVSRTTSAQTALAVSECVDKIDNDNDGLVDWPNDPDCTDRKGASEGVKQELLPPTISQCSDGLDNDGDSLIDYDQELVGCETTDDNDETDVAAATDTLSSTEEVSSAEETAAAALPEALQCADGIDNDGDGLIDYAGGDPGCSGEADSSEEDYVPPQETSGGEGTTAAPSVSTPVEALPSTTVLPEELPPEEQLAEEKKSEAQQTVAESTVLGRAEKTIERLTKGETIIVDTSQVIAEVKSVEMTAKKDVYGVAFKIEKTEKSIIPPPAAKNVISTFHIEGPESDKVIEVKVELSKYTDKTTANCFDTKKNKWRPGKVKEKKSDEKYVYLKVALPCRN